MYVLPPRFVLSTESTQVKNSDPMWALERFEQSPHPGVWRFIDKSRIIQEIHDRLQTPFTAYHGRMCLSGAAAIAAELLRKNPFRYVCLCHSLFETGGFQTPHQRVQASEHIRQIQISDYWVEQCPPHTFGIAPAISALDWMLLTTFHETQLSAFPTPLFMPLMPQAIVQTPQLAKPWELKGWLKEVLGYQNVRFHHAHLGITLPSARRRLWKRATKVISKGGVAIALVTSAPLPETHLSETHLSETHLFESASTAPTLKMQPYQPNHWVSLTPFNPGNARDMHGYGPDRFEKVWGILIAK